MLAHSWSVRLYSGALEKQEWEPQLVWSLFSHVGNGCKMRHHSFMFGTLWAVWMKVFSFTSKVMDSDSDSPFNYSWPSFPKMRICRKKGNRMSVYLKTITFKRTDKNVLNIFYDIFKYLQWNRHRTFSQHDTLDQKYNSFTIFRSWQIWKTKIYSMM